MFRRNEHNPLLTPRQVTPSQPGFEVVGVFNAGVAELRDKVVLLARVAERPIQADSEWIAYPRLAADNQITVQRIRRDDPQFDVSDPRIIRDRRTGEVMLTSISHIRLAWSADGVSFNADDSAWLRAQAPYETFGVEDARVTKIGETYYVNYSAVSPYGIATALVSTRDFGSIQRHGIILPPANRDVTLFPEQIAEQYVCYHRPMPGTLGGLNIWLATSPDLIHWGQHRLALESRAGGWEAGRVGGGAPPVRTERGWLSIYHAADPRDRYCLGAFLTPLDEPWRVIARSRQPILEPEASYETQGFFPNVVFTCGALVQNGQLRIYYGASDDVIALAEAPLDAVLDGVLRE